MVRNLSWPAVSHICSWGIGRGIEKRRKERNDGRRKERSDSTRAQRSLKSAYLYNYKPTTAESAVSYNHCTCHTFHIINHITLITHMIIITDFLSHWNSPQKKSSYYIAQKSPNGLRPTITASPQKAADSAVAYKTSTRFIISISSFPSPNRCPFYIGHSRSQFTIITNYRQKRNK